MITIHENLIQGTDEWLEVRRGMVTASAVGQLITVSTLGATHFACPECEASEHEPCIGKRGPIQTMHRARSDFAREKAVTVVEPAATPESKTLTILLAAERITGWVDPMYVSDDMLRGIEDEPVARARYAECYAPVTECGFMVEDRWGFQIGYSPDGLVGDDGLIEIKSRRPKAQLATILADEVPAANMAQLQCGLLVTGRQWIDYVSYCGGMPLYVKRVLPQPQWAEAIVAAVNAFEDTVADIIGTYTTRTAGLHTTERRIELEISI